jgi:hypothetical protein
MGGAPPADGNPSRSPPTNYPSPLIQDQLSMNADPMAGPVQGLITGVPVPASFADQRINNHDRWDINLAQEPAPYQTGLGTPSHQLPYKLKKEKGAKNVKVTKSNVITRFAYSTREGFSVHNVNKKNQDNFILAPNICQTFHQHFFAVCDGHG